MNRRKFIKAVSGAALLAATPLKYVHEPTYEKARAFIGPSITEIVSNTLRSRGPALAESIQKNNELLKRLQERGTMK